MATETTKHGRSADSIVEDGAGGEYHRAIMLYELAGNLEAVVGEFAYETDEPTTDLLRMARDLLAHVERLSIADDASLTLNRTCPACDGSGRFNANGGACDECDGTGVAIRDSQDTKEAR